VTTRLRVRQVVNWLNLSTPAGLLIAVLGRASIRKGDRGTYLATSYRWRFPIGGAFTVGNVIMTRHDEAWCANRPAMMRHEDRHCTQFAFFLGPAMSVPYVLCAAVSWVLSGSHAAYNPFERMADLVDGGYPQPALWFRSSSGPG
jgi:hypothetical protein